MKIIIGFIFCLVTACSAQKDIYKLKNIEMKIKDINTDIKTLDIKKFEDYKDKLEKKLTEKIVLINDSQSNKKDSNAIAVSEEFFYKSYDGYKLDRYNSKNEKIQEIKIPNDKSLMIEVKEKIDAYFDYYETYFGNGKIHSKRISSSLGFEIGKKITFTENQEISEVIDTDEGYKFNYESIFKFCKEKKILLNTQEFPVRIMKTISNEGLKTWVIEYPNNQIHKIEIYVLDAKTGNQINKVLRDWPVFKHKNVNKK